jgi:ABC-type amino acid transport system permease subunit
VGSKGECHLVVNYWAGWALSVITYLFVAIFQVTPVLGLILIILCLVFVVEPVRGQIERSQNENGIVADEEVIIRHSWLNDVEHILLW